MPQSSSRLALPLIQPAQAQKHVTHNAAIEMLDALVQLTLQAIDATTPPVAPAEGEAWALGPAPTGAWAGQPGMVASFRGGGWLFLTPQTGWQAWVTGLGDIRVYDGTTWVAIGGSGAPSFQNLPGVGINATSDATNKLAVSADATLLNHAGGGHQLKINKSAPPDTASLLFQSGFSGRAEMGLAGADDFAIKVSDGVTWFPGLSVLGASGAVRIDQILTLPPRSEPSGGVAGDIYFDSTLAKLRCHDGAVWQNLF